MKYYNQKAPDKLRAVFEKHGVGGANLHAVMNAANEYASDLALIDEGTRAEILAKYGYKGRYASAAARINAERGRPTASGAPARPLLLDLKPGQNLSLELKKDGTTARNHAQKAAALNRHRQTLTRALGPAAARNLEDWVDVEVAPIVREVVQAAPATRSATNALQLTGYSTTTGAR